MGKKEGFSLSKIWKNIYKAGVKIGEKITNSVSQNEAVEALGELTVTEGMPEILRKAAAESCVLLKNNGILPYSDDSVVSVFGRNQIDWFFTGYGSGGDVKKPYGKNLIDGLNECNIKYNKELAEIYSKWSKENPIDHGVWGMWPRFYPDMILTEDTVKNAAEKSSDAIFIIGRSSGEDRENVLEKGSYYITDEEKANINLITKYFDKVTVLLNIGSVIDMSWITELGDKIGAVMIVWQGGMESGTGIADLLCGNAVPCGKLPDTIVKCYDKVKAYKNFGTKDYNNYEEDIYVGYRAFETGMQDEVLYPFGFGLSYTTFDIKYESAEVLEESVKFSVTVTNTGDTKGKEIAEAYISKPKGVLGNPERELVAFAKTKELAPGESETLTLEVPKYYFTSYDDNGVTGFAYSYVLQDGEYGIYIGKDVRDAQKVWSYYQEKTECFEKLKQVSAPSADFNRWKITDKGFSTEKAPKRKYDLKEIIIENLPEPIPMTVDRGLKLADVKNGKCTMDEFAAQLNLTELEAISRGAYKMDSPLGAKGNAGAIGGVTESLREKGVPALITTDGPSGIRLLSYCSLIPIGTAFASSFDTELIEEVYSALSVEMKEKGSDILLAPGMNIHRNPLCGRNFEYYSEDPVLTGKMGAAAVRGIQKCGGSATPKHFACNNQETNRTYNDSRVSERALREIYLKGFEICIKEGKPNCIMTSYNKINGVWGHYNYELCQRILRDEWNFDGMVMTDWWMRKSKSPEFPKMRDNAYRVRASVDVLMPGGDRLGKEKPDGTLLKTLGKPEGITSAEMQRTAKRVLNLCIKYL